MNALTATEHAALLANVAAPRLPASCADNVLYATGRPTTKRPTTTTGTRQPSPYHSNGNPFARGVQRAEAHEHLHGQKTSHVTHVKFPTDGIGRRLVALFCAETGMWSNFVQDETNKLLLDALEDAGITRDGANHPVDWSVFWGNADMQNIVLKPITFNKSEEPMGIAQDNIARTHAEFERAHAAGEAKAAVPKPPSEFDTFDKPIAPLDEPKTAEWVKDTAKKNTFFGRWVKMCDEFHVPADKELREQLRKDTLVRLTQHDSLTYWERSAAELLTELSRDLLATYGEKTPATENAPEAATSPVNEAPAVVAPETPNAPSAPVPASAETTKEGTMDKPTEPLIDKAQFRKERTIKVSGQKYLKAGDRVIMFRADHPDWTLETETVAIAPDFAVFKALVKDNAGRVISTGHGYCTPDLAQKVSGRFVEKAETAAIARALALAGYGSDDTLDDSDYLSDSPISKAA